MAYVPERGDVVWISFDPQMGHEQAGRRPALVLSDQSYNVLLDLAVVCPITNKAKGFSFEIPVPQGLAVTGVVLCDHVKSIDWRARKAAYLCTLPMPLVEAVSLMVRKLV
jgi:mRNA interferase MazF